MKKTDLLWVILSTFFLCACFGVLFFDLGLFSFLLFPFIFPLLLKYMKRIRREQYVSLVKTLFLLLLRFMTVGLKNGESLEHACLDAYKELGKVTEQKRKQVTALEGFATGIRSGSAPETEFLKLADTTGVREIRDFSEILSDVRAYGGDLLTVIHETEQMLTLTASWEEETRALLSGKVTEKNLMLLSPLLLLLYLRVSAPDMLEPLYTGSGRIIMAAALLLYAGSAFWSGRILNNIR